MRGDVRANCDATLAAWAVYGALEEILTGWVLGQLRGEEEDVERAIATVVGVASQDWRRDRQPARRRPAPADDEGHSFRRLFLGEPAGAERTGFAVYELQAGEKAWPYHYELSEEEWLFVIEGAIDELNQ